MLQRYKNPQKVAHPRLVVSGDTTTLRQMLQQDPELVQARSTRKHHATLLHYIAANGVLHSPRKLSVGPVWSPSAVWLKTTSRMTSIPARCSALTMSRNSSAGPRQS